MEQKHTPLPYHHWTGGKIISDNHDAGEYYGWYGKPVVQANNPETAEFIVRACNSHYELLKIIRKAAEDLKDAESLYDDKIIINYLEEAIAKAEGK